MQGVEFDNGDMYVDGHKAASDVRDEFVSVTEKLMDELAQCYNVLPQLDINNTKDHRPEGDEKWFLENEKTVTQFCFFFQAEDGIRDVAVTGVQTCALPIFDLSRLPGASSRHLVLLSILIMGLLCAILWLFF